MAAGCLGPSTTRWCGSSRRKTSSAPANCSPPPKVSPQSATLRPTARPKHLCLRADARVAAAGWSSSRRSKAYALRNRHRQAGSGSTPHDLHCASRLATRFLLASSRAPEQEADVLRRSPVLLRPPCPRQARAYSRPNTPAVVGPAGKTPKRKFPQCPSASEQAANRLRRSPTHQVASDVLRLDSYPETETDRRLELHQDRASANFD